MQQSFQFEKVSLLHPYTRVAEKIEDDFYLTGHLAYGNPLWKTFEEVQDILVIFNGPHAYISSSWYEHENVPTWNYQAVHVYGKASLIEGIALEQDLTSLLENMSHSVKILCCGINYLLSFCKEEMKGIKGFKIKVEEVQANL